MKDKCIVCGEETPYDETVDVNMRTCYVDGVGQLCVGCWKEVYKD